MACGVAVGQSVLELSGVSKTYGTFRAVDDLSFSVEPGEIFGFLGPNGAGKTTTLRMILDIIRPTTGRVMVLGAESALDVRHRLGYLPEERGLYKKMTAVQTITYFAQLKGMNGAAAKRRAMELLERFGLTDFAKAKIEALSKGMAQKVQVLSAIAHEPELVILDEPFSGLDPVNQQVLEEMILDLAGQDRTILFSTHVMQHAERLCDRLLLIAQGKNVFYGTLQEARETLPRRVRIETDDRTGEDVRLLEGLPGVVSIEPIGDGEHPGRWEAELRQGADPQEILKACFERGIRLRQFDLSEPSLHEIFVQLVGPEAREVHFR